MNIKRKFHTVVIVAKKVIVIEDVYSYMSCLGVILFKINKETLRSDPENSIKYLLVQRRDTLGYVEFMRGKYNLENGMNTSMNCSKL